MRDIKQDIKQDSIDFWHWIHQASLDILKIDIDLISTRDVFFLDWKVLNCDFHGVQMYPNSQPLRPWELQLKLPSIKPKFWQVATCWCIVTILDCGVLDCTWSSWDHLEIIQRSSWPKLRRVPAQFQSSSGCSTWHFYSSVVISGPVHSSDLSYGCHDALRRTVSDVSVEIRCCLAVPDLRIVVPPWCRSMRRAGQRKKKQRPSFWRS